MARQAAADAWGREERPRERARATGRARAAPGSEGSEGGCTAGLDPGNCGAGTVKQGSRGSSQR
jgi:hypothetical protein